MMFADELAKIPLEKVCPVNEDDIMMILDKNTALALGNIQNDSGKFFSIKGIIEQGINSKSEENVFGDEKFEERCSKFVEVLETRLERYFDTKKTKYIFFDKEEQMYIKKILDNNRLSCVIKIYLRKSGEQFKPVEFEEITSAEYNQVKKYLRKYNIKYVIRPDRYMELKVARDNKAKEFKRNFEQKKERMKMDQMKPFFEKYPELELADKKEDVSKLRKSLAKKYHSDVNAEDTEKMAEINSDFDEISTTMWYKELGEPKKEEPVIDKAKNKKVVSSKKNKGVIFKAFKYMTTKD